MLRKTAKSVLFLFILGDLVLINVLFVADGVKGFHSLIDRIGIDPVIFAILSIAVIGILRVWKKTIVPSIFFYTYLYILVPVSAVLALILTYIELTHYYNYLYSHFLIYFDRIVLWAILTSVIGLILMPEKLFKKYWFSIIFGLPIWFLAVMALIWTWPQDVFLQLVKEDHLIENSQVFVLIMGVVAAFFLAKSFIRQKLFLMAIIFLLVSGGLFFVSGDEISWGQRLFGFITPTEFAQENLQDEVTVHNINGIHQLIGYGYILIGLYGSFAWIVADNFLKKYHKWTRFFVPSRNLFFFFYLSLIYNSYALGGVNHFKEWSEVAELMLYSGISLFLIKSVWSKNSD